MHNRNLYTVGAVKKSDGGTDYALMALIDGKARVVGEAFEVVGHGVRVDAFANARLWSAAAELLASLEEMIACYGSDDGGGPIPIIERARAAAAKAKMPS